MLYRSPGGIEVDASIGGVVTEAAGSTSAVLLNGVLRETVEGIDGFGEVGYSVFSIRFNEQDVACLYSEFVSQLDRN